MVKVGKIINIYRIIKLRVIIRHFHCLNSPCGLDPGILLTLWSVRIPVPLQSPCVMPVEEVWLGPQGADVRVEPQKLQQCPSTSFFDPYD